MLVSELTGALLDYWVARAEGWGLDPYRPPKEKQLRKPFRESDVRENRFMGIPDGDDRLCIAGGGEYIPERCAFRPSTDWAQGGSIIEREGISLLQIGQGDSVAKWSANFETWYEDRDDPWTGPTPLIAAMRAFVASKYGDTVPDEPV